MAWQHPELKPGEVFIGNVRSEQFGSIGWQTKRAGSVAYDINNNQITGVNDLFPVFVKMSEVESAGVILPE